VTDHWREAKGEMLRPRERELLYELARYTMATFEYPVVVNIGVSWGASVHCLYAGSGGAYILAIDIDYETRPVKHPELLGGVEFVEADSTTFEYDVPVHLAFVDGGHDYRTVKADIENLVPHIPLGGVIAFHDYAPAPRDAKRLAGVKRAVDEWRDEAGKTWALRWAAGSIVAYQRVK
jgi:hypothetical protein